MAACVFIGRLVDGLHVAFENNLAAQSSGVRTNVYQVIGRTYYLLVVFYYNHCVVESLELFQHVYKTLSVAAVQSDARFVEYIDRADE